MTRLIPVAPRGIGTPWVESLTSLVRRLAFHEARRVRDVISILGVSIDGRQRSSPSMATAFINGAHPTGRRLVDELERATGRDDIGATTLLTLERGIYVHGGMRPERRWCPACLAEDGYDQLLFSLRDYTVCVRHALVLQQRCPLCNQPQRPWSHRAGAQKCLGCGGSLTIARVPATPSASDEACVQIMGLVASGETIPPGGVARALQQHMKQEEISENHFALETGIVRSRLRFVLSGLARPGLDFVVRIIAETGLRATDMTRPGTTRVREKRSAGATRQDLAAFAAALDRELAKSAEARRTLTELAAALGSSTAYLRSNLPAQSQLIVRDGALLRTARTEAKLSAQREVILAAAERLRRRGEPISTHRLGREIGDHHLLRTLPNQALVAKLRAVA